MRLRTEPEVIPESLSACAQPAVLLGAHSLQPPATPTKRTPTTSLNAGIRCWHLVLMILTWNTYTRALTLAGTSRLRRLVCTKSMADQARSAAPAELPSDRMRTATCISSCTSWPCVCHHLYAGKCVASLQMDSSAKEPSLWPVEQTSTTSNQD